MGDRKGRPRIVHLTTTSGGAGNITHNLQPPTGVYWVIKGAWGYHDVGAGLACVWYFTDPIGNAQLFPTVALAVNTPLALGASVANTPNLMMADVKATYARFPSFIAVATGAAQTAVLNAVVEEYSGAPES